MTLPSTGADLAIADNVAYVATTDSLLQVIDVFSETSPQLLATLPLPRRGFLTAAVRDWAFVVDTGGLQIVDTAIPASPTLRGRVALPASAHLLEATSSMACVGLSEGVVIVDVSNRDAPVVRGAFNFFQEYVTSIAVLGDYAYVGTARAYDKNEGQLYVLAIPPSSPPHIVTSLPGLYVDALAVEADRSELAVLHYGMRIEICRTHYSSGVLIYDLTDPAHPSQVALLSLPDDYAPDAMTFADSRLTVMMLTPYEMPLHRLLVIDRPSLATLGEIPTSPLVLAQTPLATWGLGREGPFEVGSFLVALDGPAPLAPTLSSLRMASDTGDVAIHDHFAYVATLDTGRLEIVDIADPEHPVARGVIAARGRDVAIEHPLAYVAGHDFYVVDVADPTAPRIISSTPIGTLGTGLAIEDGYAYIAGDYSGLIVVDISDALNPTVVGNLDTPGIAQQIAVDGDIAYIADTDQGLELVDVSDPHAPTMTGSVTTPGQAHDVEVRWPYAYVADSSVGLVVVDVTNPSSPVVAGQTSGFAQARRLALHDSLAYVTSDPLGLLVFDISMPPIPRLVGSNPTVSGAIALDSTVVCIASSSESQNCGKSDWEKDGRLVVLPPACKPTVSEVALSYFNYEIVGTAIELHWDSAFENAHLGYRVLRALSPESGFPHIGPKLIEGPGPYSLRDDDVVPGRTYYYRLEALGRNGSRQQFGPLRATLLLAAPLALSLAIGPTPNSEAPVEFHVVIPRTMPISLRLFDVRGRHVKTLTTAMAGPGEFRASWDGTDDRNRPVSSGVFFCQLQAGSQTITKRLVRLK